MRDRPFSPQRALESVLFIATRLIEKRLTSAPTIHQILKLRYFADKLHLSAYGFAASGDDYSAMEFGPVASETYNLLKAARGEKSSWIDPSYAELTTSALEVRNRLFVYPQRQPNLDALAPSDVECLLRALDEYGRMSFTERTLLSHDDAWSRAWHSAATRGVESEKMPLADIAKTLNNAPDVIEYLSA